MFKSREFPIAVVLVATGLLFFALAAWAIMGGHPLTGAVAIAAGSLSILRVATSLWLRRYAKRT